MRVLPDEAYELIGEAARRGYLRIDEANERITYHCARRHTEVWSDPEEHVRAFTYSYLILKKGYLPERLRVEVQVPRRAPSDFGNIVVYRENGRTPYLVVEDKARHQSARSRAQGIEQGFGNAHSLRDTELVLYDEWDQSLLFDTAGFPPDERKANYLGNRERIPVAYGRAPTYRFIAGVQPDIGPMDRASSRQGSEGRTASSGQGGGAIRWRRSTSGRSWSSPRSSMSGTPRTGHRGVFKLEPGRPPVQVGSRVRELFTDAAALDPSIFAGADIDLPDDKLVEVVKTLEDVG